MKHFMVVSVGASSARLVMSFVDRFASIAHSPLVTLLHLDFDPDVVTSLRSRSHMTGYYLSGAIDLRFLASRIGGGRSYDEMFSGLDPTRRLPSNPLLLRAVIDMVWEQDLADRLLKGARKGLTEGGLDLVMLTDWDDPVCSVLAASVQEHALSHFREYNDLALTRSNRLSTGSSKTAGVRTTVQAPEELAALLVADCLDGTDAKVVVSGMSWLELKPVSEDTNLPGLGHLLECGKYTLLTGLMSELPWAEARGFLAEVWKDTFEALPTELSGLARVSWIADSENQNEFSAAIDPSMVLRLASDDDKFCEAMCKSGHSALATRLFGMGTDINPDHRAKIIEGFCREQREAELERQIVAVSTWLPSLEQTAQGYVVLPAKLRQHVLVEMVGRTRFSALLEGQAVAFSLQVEGSSKTS